MNKLFLLLFIGIVASLLTSSFAAALSVDDITNFFTFVLHGGLPVSITGAAVVVPVCAGAPVACSSYSVSTSCASQSGCSWVYKCSGTATGCNGLNEYQCDAQLGCSWNDNKGHCIYVATQCQSITNLATCNGQLGCSWINCAGTPTSCSALVTQTSCQAQGGCAWTSVTTTTTTTTPAISTTTTTTLTTTTTITTTTTTTTTSYIKSGKYVDVDWSTFPNNAEVADWGVKTGDAQYSFLAKIQDIPLNMMRSRTPVKLDNGVGGWASGGNIGVNVDWFFGKNLVSSSDSSSPSYGMTPKNYSLQRLDAEYYHELSHNIPKSCGSYCPSWFAENLGTWAQSAVSKSGAFTGIKAQMEDALVENGAYSNPNAFIGYGKGAAFFWWLTEKYGIDGLDKMIHQCFGYSDEHSWQNDNDIDTYGFIPWTGKTSTQLAQDFYNDISSGWRANITKIMSGVDLTKISQENVKCYQNVNIRAQLDSCNFATPSNNGCYNTIPAKITVTYYEGGIQKTQTGSSDFTITADLESNITVSTADTSYNFVSWNDFGCWGWSYDNPHTYYLHNCAPLEINKRTIIGYFKPQNQIRDVAVTSLYAPCTTTGSSCGIDAYDGQQFAVKAAVANLGNYPENGTVTLSACPNTIQPVNSAIQSSQTSTATSTTGGGGGGAGCKILFTGLLSLNPSISSSEQSSQQYLIITSLPVGYYNLQFTTNVVDDTNTANNNLNTYVYVQPVYPTYTINFQPGWNLFSVPVSYINSADSNCVPTSPIYALSNGVYYQTNYISGSYGYWVDMNSSCYLNVTGPSISINDFQYIYQGWNMIGAPSRQVNFADVVGSCNVTRGPLWFDPSTNSYVSSTTLQPGKGYFLKVDQSCQLGIGLPPPPPQ